MSFFIDELTDTSTRGVYRCLDYYWYQHNLLLGTLLLYTLVGFWKILYYHMIKQFSITISVLPHMINQFSATIFITIYDKIVLNYYFFITTYDKTVLCYSKCHMPGYIY